MFTGLIQHVGQVESAERSGGGLRLVVDISGWNHQPALGDSIAVSGVCLTVAPGGDPSRGRVAFDLVAETVARTTLGDARPGTRVNLEHAVRADTLMGGHFVQGHVEGVGEVTRVQDSPADCRVEFRVARELMDAIVPKGSIAVDGVSLTIATVTPEGFGVALIPTTLVLTTLGELKPGARCNIETDMIARQVAHVLRMRGA